jgi:hypothetical protein
MGESIQLKKLLGNDLMTWRYRKEWTSRTSTSWPWSGFRQIKDCKA